MKYFDEITPDEQEQQPRRKIDFKQTEFDGDPLPLWWHVSRLSASERRDFEMKAFRQMFHERFVEAAV